MNILFLSPRFPLPADTGGKIRTFNILKQLAKFAKVHLLCFSFETADKNYIKNFQDLGISVALVEIENPNIFIKISGVFFNPIPFSISKYYSIRMRQAIEDTLKRQTFEAIHVDHLHLASYTGCFNNTSCVLDEHNVEFRILERCAEVENSLLKRILYFQQAQKMKSFESQKLKDFDAIFACSLDDQKILEKIGTIQTPVYVIPNGVDTEYFNTTLMKSLEEDALVFTGSMDWLPNDDAISYFCRHILPLIWQKKPKVKFYVVGKNPSSLVKDLAKNDSRVIVTGRVDDVRPFIERSKVFIVPLRIGGGTRLKILEAMSMGKAVVSTTIGAEGIACQEGIDIFLGDSPQEFADKVLILLEDHQQAKNLGLASRNLVCRQYDWNSIGKELKKNYEGLNGVKKE